MSSGPRTLVIEARLARALSPSQQAQLEERFGRDFELVGQGTGLEFVIIASDHEEEIRRWLLDDSGLSFVELWKRQEGLGWNLLAPLNPTGTLPHKD